MIAARCRIGHAEANVRLSARFDPKAGPLNLQNDCGIFRRWAFVRASGRALPALKWIWAHAHHGAGAATVDLSNTYEIVIAVKD